MTKKTREKAIERKLKYKTGALEKDPDGGTCGHCGGPNDFCDDCGFFYWSKRTRGCVEGKGRYIAGCWDCKEAAGVDFGSR